MEKPHVRSLSKLIELHPTKTGREIQEMHDKEQEELKLWNKKLQEKSDARILAWMEELRSAQFYYSESVGFGQKRWMKIIRIYVEYGNVLADIEGVIIHNREDKPEDASIYHNNREGVRIADYSLDPRDIFKPITEKLYNKMMRKFNSLLNDRP